MTCILMAASDFAFENNKLKNGTCIINYNLEDLAIFKNNVLM